MGSDELVIGVPMMMGLAYWGRKALEIPTRLPAWDGWLRRIWLPATLLLVGSAGLPDGVANWLGTLFTVGVLGVGVGVGWQLRAWRPAWWTLLALAPSTIMGAAELVIRLFTGGKSPGWNWFDTLDMLAFLWAIGGLLVARGQKKTLAAETERREQTAKAQQLVETQNQALEYEASQRTAALSHQTDELRATLAELQATQDQLIQREKMASLGELTAGIAHEIQNPLNFVNNFADVSAELVAELEEERARPQRDAATEAELLADLRQNLQRISQHGRRASGIVRGMLAHSRQGSGERQPVDVNALCDEYLRLAYHGLRAKDKTFNARLDTDFAADLPRVEAVPGDLGRVLLNLFTNAFYAVQKRQQTGEPGFAPRVGLGTRLAGEEVEIQVADNGTGMSPEVQAKIFQPFFTTKPTGEGTGLGLSLSHDIITQGHGGSLGAQSQEGQGTTFTIRLPR